MLDLTIENKKLYKNIINNALFDRSIDVTNDFIQEPFQIHNNEIRKVNGICPFCGDKYESLYISNFRPVNREFYDRTMTDTEIYELKNESTNKILICSDCLQFKRTNYGTNDVTLINPLSSYDKVQTHFYYDENGEIIGLSSRGDITIQILGLNRRQLIKQRFNIINEQKLTANSIFSGTPNFNPMNDFEQKFLELWRQLIVLEDINTAIFNERAIRIINIESLKDRKQQFVKKFKNQHYRIVNQTHHIQYDYNYLDEMYYINDLSDFQIGSVEIENFKNISSMKININKSENKIGQWTSILGENGTGKTSILQAIALTLVPKSEMLYNIKRLNFNKKVNLGNVKINSTYYDDISIELNMPQRIKYPLIIAYGSIRLSDGIYASKADSIHSIRNLFNPRKSLENPEKFLMSLSDENFNLVTKQIKHVFKEEIKIIRNGQALFFSISNGKFSFNQLSDGYRIILSLVCDIISTINKRYKSYEGKAIVLIDELENHLHPKWIIELPQILKKVFPYVQFITTTHNPLLIRQLDSSEIIVLSKENNTYDSNTQYVARYFKDVTPLSSYSIDHLLTTDFFNLYDTNPQLNREISQLYEKMQVTDNFSFEDYKNILQEKNINRRYSGTRREYYYQYLLDEILLEEDKRGTTDKLLKSIKNLAIKIVDEEDNEQIYEN